ncbi:MAG: hypothetical protein J0I54_05780 [Bosea sp.]|uniref:SspB family protein n=1 Tax=unclassified Bosea (in: a-proteobacteria) TaxID=2653178 RepID=UPI00095FECDA|nr:MULTISPECIES: ClpXP protease specificity-enhancing factor SspB [unclassified Bosea (in: a-proteobacteria)]MBN9456121.1 hypothetical protein [Bosea sp. (in: a-proteobacteria)]OJV05635.1 MAG: Stringent starvation protein B [Bosea sp. 67-29]
MSKDVLRYDLMVQEALKGVVRKILSEAARDGLPGEHHFYVTFRTGAPGVRLSQRLREKHPDEMTIVLQHQFWDLSVSEHAFEVGLSFSGVPERLLVPFDAVTTFFDPSVQFGLKFETQDAPEDAGTQPEAETADASTPLPAKVLPAAVPATKAKPVEAEIAGADKDAAADEGDSDSRGTAEVVSLDSFRKKT